MLRTETKLKNVFVKKLSVRLTNYNINNIYSEYNKIDVNHAEKHFISVKKYSIN